RARAGRARLSPEAAGGSDPARRAPPRARRGSPDPDRPRAPRAPPPALGRRRGIAAGASLVLADRAPRGAGPTAPRLRDGGPPRPRRQQPRPADPRARRGRGGRRPAGLARARRPGPRHRPDGARSGEPSRAPSAGPGNARARALPPRPERPARPLAPIALGQV